MKSEPTTSQPTAAPAAPPRPELALEDWHVCFTGHFEQRPRADLEKELRRRGVRVSPSIIHKTTHLVLGDRSGKAPYGNWTGIGGCKHQRAVAMDLPIVGEEEIWERVRTTKTLGRWHKRNRKGAKRKRAGGAAGGSNVKLEGVEETGGADEGEKNDQRPVSKRAKKEERVVLVEESDVEE